MKKFAIEIKWGIIFTLVALLWMVLEKQLGWHDELISKHAVYTNLFAIPAILVFVLAIFDKRKNYFHGKMTWLQGFLAGIGVTLVVAVLSPLSQYITTTMITPEYFPNVIAYSVENGKLSQEQAEKYFSLSNYIVQSIVGGVVMGVITSAIVAIFARKK